MRKLRQKIDKPFVRPEFSKAELQGDELVVTLLGTKPRSYVSRVLAFVPCLGIVAAGYFQENILLLKSALIPLLGALAYLFVSSKKKTYIAPQQLRISPRGLSIISDKPGGDFSSVSAELIPLESFERCYLNQPIEDLPDGLRGHFVELSNYIGDKPTLFEEPRVPGIYFQRKDGSDLGFALNHAGTGGPVGRAYSLRDYKELRWLFSVIETYLDALLGASKQGVEGAASFVSDATQAPDDTVILSDTEAW